MKLQQISKLTKPNESKIVLLVMDGLGGAPGLEGGMTALESAHTPNMDALAKGGISGLHVPVASGVTPGSGPSHLAVFGYDPVEYEVGRGTLSALGVGFDLQPSDVAARGNFCTVDENGVITDRRGGRISTEKNRELCERLREIKIPDVEVYVQTVKEHRFLFVLRGTGLGSNIADTDPHEVGNRPHEPKAGDGGSERTADITRQFVSAAGKVLGDMHPANMILLRGFSERPNWPTMKEAFGIRSAAIAGYPMYRGLGTLLGMDVIDTGSDLRDELDALTGVWNTYDFFYLHVKGTDSAGEDGDIDRKVRVIEEVDGIVPRILDLGPEVMIVTGDHSTPAVMKSHSWHPVPTLLWSRSCRPDGVERFGESSCLAGGLGAHFPATDIMPLALANAGRLTKYGA